MKQLIFPIFTLIGLSLCYTAGAQAKQPASPDAKKIGVSPTVEIITDYQGKVIDADKIAIPYSVDSLSLTIPAQSYQVIPLSLSNDFNMQAIPAAGVNIQGEVKELGIGYFRGSLGYPITPDLNLYLHGHMNEHSSVNIYINHHSFWGNLPMYTDAPQTSIPLPSEIIGNDAKTKAGVTLQHFWRKTAFDVNVEYTNRYYLFHGQDTLLLKQNAGGEYIQKIMDKSYMKEYQSQTLHIINTKARFYSLTNSKTKFSVGGSYDYIKETAHRDINNPIKQGTVGLDLQLNQNVGRNHALDLKLTAQAYNRYNKGNLSDAVFSFVPAYQLESDHVSLSLGLNAEGVYSNNEFALNIYPKAGLSVKTISTFLTPYISVSGNTTLNNYEKIINENSYILPGLDVAHTRNKFDINAGIRGSLNNYLAYQVNVGYAMIDSMYFFTNSTTPLFSDGVVSGPLRSNFDVRYDNISKLAFDLGISTKVGSFEGLLKAQYVQYSMSNEAKAWHLPNINVGLNLRYTVASKLIFNIDGTFRGEAPVWLSSDYPESATVTPAYINLGAMVEYRLNPKTSVYIQASNLLNNNYQQYYLYYNPGITVSAGFSIVF